MKAHEGVLKELWPGVMELWPGVMELDRPGTYGVMKICTSGVCEGSGQRISLKHGGFYKTICSQEKGRKASGHLRLISVKNIREISCI